MAAHLPPGCNSTVRELGFSAVPYSMPKDTLPNRVAGQVGGRTRGGLQRRGRGDRSQRSVPPSCAALLQDFRRAADTDILATPPTLHCQVLERLMGKPPLFERSGATIPALAAFQTHLNISTTVFAFGCVGGWVGHAQLALQYCFWAACGGQVCGGSWRL